MNKKYRDKVNKIFDAYKDSELLFIVPPFSLVDLPCLGVEILQNIARTKNVKASILYANLLFAEYISVEKYQYVTSKLMSLYDLIGERIFVKAAYANMPEMGCNFQKHTDDVIKNFFEGQYNISSMATEWVEFLSKKISQLPVKLVGITTGHQQTNAAIALINHIKDQNQKIVTFMGGSACDGDLAEGIVSLSENIDYVFSGESEIGFARFLDGYLSQDLPSEKIIRSEYLANLDDITIDDKTYNDYSWQYRLLNGDNAPIALLYETSRGCWWGEKHKCAFCGVNGWNKHYRSKTEDKIIQDITTLLNNHKTVCHIQMVDTLMPRKFSNTLLATLKEMLGDATLFYEQRADLTLNQVVDLKLSGVKYTQVGIEALSTELLKKVNKGIDAKQNINFLRWARSVGMIIGWNLLSEIPNDKCEDWETVLSLIPYITHLNPPLQVRPVEVVRFSPYFERPSEFSVKSMKPYEIYEEIFPKDSRIDKLAWLYKADFESESKHDLELNKRIQAVINEWIMKWKNAVSNIPVFRVIRENGNYFVEDTRFDHSVKEAITYQQAALLLLGVQLGEENSELDWALDNKMLFLLDGYYLPLATANPYLLEEFLNA